MCCSVQHVLGLPVNLRVVLTEPGEAQDHALLAQLRDHKLSAFHMPIVPEDDICNLVDCTTLIGCSIDIVDWDLLSECACPFDIHKQPCCTAVNQQPSAAFDTSVCGLDFNVNVKGVGTGSGGDDVPMR